MDKEYNANHHPCHYIIKDEVFEEMKKALLEILRKRKESSKNKQNER